MEEFDGNFEDNGSGALHSFDGDGFAGIAIELSPERDIPLLLAIRNCTFISHDQLFQIMVEAGLEHNRRCFNWRVRRLAQAAHVRKTRKLFPYKGVVYSITRLGLNVLESCGEGLVSVTSGSRNLANILQAPHFLELNEIHHAFRRTGKLASWRSDRELISLNYVIGTPLAKDYDAIAEVKLEDDSLRIAVEYEKTLKAAARYKEIQKAICDERQIDLILYLTSTLDLVFTLYREFDCPSLPMCFVSSGKLRTNLLDTSVLFAYGSMRETFSLRNALGTVRSIKG